MLPATLFDIILGYGCNFRCKYCFEHGKEASPPAGPGMSAETAARYSEYLKYMHRHLPGQFMSLHFFGGESLLYINRVEEIMHGTLDLPARYNLVSNGALVGRNAERLLAMQKTCRGNMGFAISYDFAFQNTTRKPGSYEDIREAIRWLYKHGLLNITIAVFDLETLPYMDETFFDFIALKKELPSLRCKFNLALPYNMERFDRAGTERALSRVREHLKNHPELHGSFFHNTMGRNHMWRVKHCLHCNVMSCINADGDMYPEFVSLGNGPEIREMLCYGSVFDDFQELNEKQDAVIAGLDLSPMEKCRTCTANCKLPLYTKYVPDGNRCSVPNSLSCEVRSLVTQYLGEFR